MPFFGITVAPADATRAWSGGGGGDDDDDDGDDAAIVANDDKVGVLGVVPRGYKMVLVVNNSLGMQKGKIGAQVERAGAARAAQARVAAHNALARGSADTRRLAPTGARAGERQTRSRRGRATARQRSASR